MVPSASVTDPEDHRKDVGKIDRFRGGGCGLSSKGAAHFGISLCVCSSRISSWENPHIIRSTDGKAALWAGAIDDIWKMGKPRGQVGPWKDTQVKAGTVSDPYLMTGYDRKSLTLAGDKDTVITTEIDLTGDGNWVTWRGFQVAAGKPVAYEFPAAFSAYWIRFKCDKDAKATAQLDYR